MTVPSPIRRRWFEEPSPFVRAAAAANANSGPSVLRRAYFDRDQAVAAAVENRACPPWLLAAAARDSDPVLRVRAASNVNTPAAGLAGLAAADDTSIRAAVASNRNCPRAVRRRFSVDPSVWVRAAALLRDPASETRP